MVKPRIFIEPENSRLFLVATKPSLQNFTEFNNPGSTLTLYLSHQPLRLTEMVANLTNTGELNLFDENEVNYELARLL